jgi:uncharacterized membrane protein
MNKDIFYSFQESIEAIDKGRGRCLSHEDYWINIIFPGRVSLLMSEWISMEDIDNLEGYDDLLWQRVHKELGPLMGPYGFCAPPTRLFYFTLLFALFSWFILGILVGRSYLWPFGFIDYGMKLILVLPWWVSLIFLAFLAGVFVFLLWSIRSKVKKCDGKLAEKSDELKELVQDLIESASELFKKENIDPQEYPLRLKFNDYHGLEYFKEEKDLEKYIAYLDV